MLLRLGKWLRRGWKRLAAAAGQAVVARPEMAEGLPARYRGVLAAAAGQVAVARPETAEGLLAGRGALAAAMGKAVVARPEMAEGLPVGPGAHAAVTGQAVAPRSEMVEGAHADRPLGQVVGPARQGSHPSYVLVEDWGR